MSEHVAPVVRIEEILPHGNADSLGLVQVEAFTVAVRLADWKPGDLAVYIEPDTVVDKSRPEFSFLRSPRITAMRLRGVWSEGLLVPAPAGMAPGDDAWQALGLERYEPPMKGTPGAPKMGGDFSSPPADLAGLPQFDVENWKRHRGVLAEGEIVFVTEKIHGANARYAFREGRMWVGSRTCWWKLDESAPNVWWKALAANPWIESVCRSWPDAVLYGEVYGQVQDLRYGAGPGEVFFRAFDVLRGRNFMDAAKFHTVFDKDCAAPLLYSGPYDPEAIPALSMGDTRLGGGHMAEGIVIRPMKEQRHPRIGRVILKAVSNRYLERQGK
jgi:RNA ligase (TIGR02306 family)